MLWALLQRQAGHRQRVGQIRDVEDLHAFFVAHEGVAELGLHGHGLVQQLVADHSVTAGCLRIVERDDDQSRRRSRCKHSVPTIVMLRARTECRQG